MAQLQGWRGKGFFWSSFSASVLPVRTSPYLLMSHDNRDSEDEKPLELQEEMMHKTANVWIRDDAAASRQNKNKSCSLTNTYAFSMIVSCFVPEKP